MPRVAGPDSALKEVEVGGRRVRRRKDGTFHLSDRAARLLVAEGGFIASDMGPAVNREHGYRCSCGFGSWFTTCSRCGGTCEKEAA